MKLQVFECMVIQYTESTDTTSIVNPGTVILARDETHAKMRMAALLGDEKLNAPGVEVLVRPFQ